MRPTICVIFNPAAQGSRAQSWRNALSARTAECSLRPTTGPGHARLLARTATDQDFHIVVAAGGDGTVNEVLNGIGDAPDGFRRIALGILPLGTANVIAHELGLPADLTAAWNVIRQGREQTFDLPYVDAGSPPTRRYFLQLAGAGWDAAAVRAVSWRLKQKLGAGAYVLAALRVLQQPRPIIRVRALADGKTWTGEQILIGNGRYYGGRWAVFPQASMHDGQLDVCVYPRIRPWTPLSLGVGLATGRLQTAAGALRFQAAQLELDSDQNVDLQVDGEWIGPLPARFGLSPQPLRMIT
jgi:diacylglycerol kinase (ATP)